MLDTRRTIESTPHERTYFLLPAERLEIGESVHEINQRNVRYQIRQQLSKMQVLLDSAGEDLAAVILPKQQDDCAENHFYKLESGCFAPGMRTEVGYLGYPGALASPFGRNYAVGPFVGFGSICDGAALHNPDIEFVLEYRPAAEVGEHNVDPHGLSGSGVWYCSQASAVVWSPIIFLGGLITRYHESSRALRCYRIEAIVDFLMQKGNEGWF